MLDYLIYLPVYGITRLARLLPLNPAMKLGEKLGWLLYKADKRHRLIAHDNLKKVWGEQKPPEELKLIARRCFSNFGQSIIEICRFPELNKDNIDEYVEVEGWENLEQASRKGKGVFVFSAHFGNWELMAAYAGLHGQPFSVISRPIDNVYIQNLVAGYRTRFGSKMIPKKNALKRFLKSLRQGENVAVLMDQSTAPSESALVTFFGHPCYTLVTPAVLALKTGCAIIPAFMTRKEGPKHKLIIEPELTIERTGNYKHDIQVITQNLNDTIEKYVTKYPDQWLWIHRRWKF